MNESDEPSMPRVRVNVILFALTVVSVFYVGQDFWSPPNPHDPWYVRWLSGWTFAVPLLAILIVHEAGHYVASRIHRVPATLPFFLPFPIAALNPFGTLGAVIVMPARIRSAKALLDIGAAGPLAGMLVAVPMMVLGLSLSQVAPVGETGYIQEGQSLLYMGLKALVIGRIPPGSDVIIHPTAAAAWAGFFVTFLNLIPFSQLDGGHVAYALFGSRYNRWSRRIWVLPAAAVLYDLVTLGGPAGKKLLSSGWRSLTEVDLRPVLSGAAGWLLPFVLILVVLRKSGGAHPPVDHPELDGRRRVIGFATLLLFVLLFMPAIMTQY